MTSILNDAEKFHSNKIPITIFKLEIYLRAIRRYLKCLFFLSQFWLSLRLLDIPKLEPLKQRLLHLSSWIKTGILMDFGRNVDVRISISLSLPMQWT